ncbi:hypothetical protein CU098_005747 [Rhizopus stolonifer]|uniref:Uncharacterized protein n=1 Tax=Rhizopus stolonifer TaxID=4846 RepID=A0A367J927_RHIST|nr:hypothetical protein CU098_005747 [Rhizopus stolonifer]
MGNPGKKLGDGWQGYCCKTDDDCRESCVNHKCNGRPNPKYAEPNLPKGCAAGSYGYGLGDGYYGDCCVNSDDCRDTCVKNKCNGPKRSSK